MTTTLKVNASNATRRACDRSPSGSHQRLRNLNLLYLRQTVTPLGLEKNIDIKKKKNNQSIQAFKKNAQDIIGSS